VVLLNDFGPVRAFGETYLAEIVESSDYDLIGKVVKPIKRDEWK
jgi:hypothetical protein